MHLKMFYIQLLTFMKLTPGRGHPIKALRYLHSQSKMSNIFSNKNENIFPIWKVRLSALTFDASCLRRKSRQVSRISFNNLEKEWRSLLEVSANPLIFWSSNINSQILWELRWYFQFYLPSFPNRQICFFE